MYYNQDYSLRQNLGKTMRKKNKKRIVIKIGSSSIVNDGMINYDFIERLVAETEKFRHGSTQVVIVTSGAIAVGKISFGWDGKLDLNAKQAFSALGQVKLIQIYNNAFGKKAIPVAQILLSRDDFKSKNRMLNFRDTMETLLKMNTVPVINENDALSNDEIKLGDNDTLGALTAVALDADDYIILSDIDGLYSGNPREDMNAVRIAEVRGITPEIMAMAGGTGSDVGTGGMVTKLSAAIITNKAGIRTHIAHADIQDLAEKIMGGGSIGTVFLPDQTIMSSKDHWIGFESRSAGKIIIDNGAIEALRKRKSLLAVGITDIEGYFKPGDSVDITDINGKLIAKGLSYLSGSQIKLIKGTPNSKHQSILKEEVHSSVIHADNIILMDDYN